METGKCGALFLFVEVQLQTGEDLSGTGGRTWPQIDYTHRTYLQVYRVKIGNSREFGGARSSWRTGEVPEHRCDARGSTTRVPAVCRSRKERPT